MRWGMTGFMHSKAALAAVLVLALAGPAMADPCKAIPDRGPAPAFLSPGRIFAGPVVYIGDGDSLCVDVGELRESSANSGTKKATKIVPFSGSSWVEVRVEDFYAPELHEPAGPAAKATLERLALGQRASCVASHQSYDRIVARCSIGGRDLGDLMRAAGVAEGGRGR
jgi:micrococcal nuclease